MDAHVGNVNGDVPLSANPLICSFTFVGSMNAFIEEANDLLRIDGEPQHDLRLSYVRGCLRQLPDGKVTGFTATLPLDQDFNPF